MPLQASLLPETKESQARRWQQSRGAGRAWPVSQEEDAGLPVQIVTPVTYYPVHAKHSVAVPQSDDLYTLAIAAASNMYTYSTPVVINYPSGAGVDVFANFEQAKLHILGQLKSSLENILASYEGISASSTTNHTWYTLFREEPEPLQPPERNISSPITVLDEVLNLRDGWDGPESIAPSAATKELTIEVFSRLASYMVEAETEVDGSTGEVGLSWFFPDDSCVSIAILPDGRVVVVEARLGTSSRQVVLNRHELDRLGRVAVDAGLKRLNG